MSCYRAVKMDSLQPHVEIYTILMDIVLSQKASPGAYYCVGTHTHTHTHTHEGEQVPSKEFGRVTASGGNQESRVYTAGYGLVVLGGGVVSLWRSLCMNGA